MNQIRDILYTALREVHLLLIQILDQRECPSGSNKMFLQDTDDGLPLSRKINRSAMGPFFFRKVALEAMAYVLPEEVWTSEAIERKLHPLYERLHLPVGRLEMMTGIRERRHWPRQMRASEASILAGKRLLEETSFPHEHIDVLLHASVCRDRLEPATAAYVHRGLGLTSKTHIVDVSNACLGVLNAMVLGGGLIESGLAHSLLIVSGENGRPLLDKTLDKLTGDTTLTRRSLKPYFSNLTIGSGAVAVLLSHTDHLREPRPLLLGGYGQTDSEACQLCEGQTEGDGLTMQTDSEELLETGLRLSTEAWKQYRESFSWDNDTPQLIVTHQVGKRHRQRLYEALGLDHRKDFSTFETLGNTGSAALPLSLAKALEKTRARPGDRVLLLGIGSGLSTLMLGLQM
jgi:3-oxoacyl-[acyl-carrier-protein] synthase-3